MMTIRGLLLAGRLRHESSWPPRPMDAASQHGFMGLLSVCGAMVYGAVQLPSTSQWEGRQHASHARHSSLHCVNRSTRSCVLRVEFWVQRPAASGSLADLIILAIALTSMQSLQLNTTIFTGFEDEQTGLGCDR